MWMYSRRVPGDLDSNLSLEANDIDELYRAIRFDEQDPDYDFNKGGRLDWLDAAFWVHNLANTWFGDTNLDGEFNSGDLVSALATGTYEANVDAGWALGDFDGNGRFDTGDLVIALADGGYEQGPRAAVSAVPEPTSMMMFIAVLMGLAIRRR